MIGRPSTFTPEVAKEICRRLALGESLIQICRDDGMPDRGTIYNWLHAHSDFFNEYARARDIQADVLAEETVTIADESTDPAKARLQVDARKWFASKVAPKKYGDRISQELSGPDGGPISTSLEVAFVEPRATADPVSDKA